MHSRTTIRTSVALLSALLLTGGCKRATSEVAGEQDVSEEREPVASVLLGAFADEAQGTAFRDSLTMEGWAPILVRGPVREQNREVTRWRVHVFPTASAELAEAAAEMFRRAGRKDAAVSREPLEGDVRDPGVQLHLVNRGSRGMASTSKWVFSPDQRTLLVMEDVASTEGYPMPNGILLAAEATGLVMQMDSVWDAAPSADWRMLAVGRAVIVDGSRGGVTSQQWRAAARAMPDDVTRDLAPGERTPAWESYVEARLRAYAFPASGMTMGSAVAIAQVIPIDSLLGVDPARRVPLARPRALRFEGWRVRWTKTGDTLAIGAAPRFPRDGLPSPRWTLVRPLAPTAAAAQADSADLAVVPWVQGPTLDVSITINLQKDTVIETRRARVESKQGFIRVSRRGGRADQVTVIGPGKPLAVTANGRFVVALVPRPNAKEGEAQHTLAVYRVVL